VQDFRPPHCAAEEEWHLAITHVFLGMTGAYATVRVPAGCHVGQLARVEAQAKTTQWIAYLYRIHDRMETTLDVDQRRTVRLQVWESGSFANRHRTELFEKDRVVVRWHEEGLAPRTVITKATPGTMDPLSTLMLLRGQPLADGDVYRVPVFSKDAVYEATIRVANREQRMVLGAEVSAVMLDATFVKNGAPSAVRAEIWLTDDARRLPFRVDAVTRFGRLRSEVTHAKGLPQAFSVPDAPHAGSQGGPVP
jgi:hypothetical protein